MCVCVCVCVTGGLNTVFETEVEDAVNLTSVRERLCVKQKSALCVCVCLCLCVCVCVCVLWNPK